MTTEQQLRERLRKIAALFEGASTVGERNAAAGAIERTKRAIDAAAKVEQPVEYQFNLPDDWKRPVLGVVPALRICDMTCARIGLVEQVCAKVGNLAGLDLGGPFGGFTAAHLPEILNESEVLEDGTRVAFF